MRISSQAAMRPAHAMRDGDTVFALAPYEDRVDVPQTTAMNLTDLAGIAAADAMVLAILDAARQTEGIDGWPSVADAQATIRTAGDATRASRA